MIIEVIFFYIFSGITLASALMVIAAKNPVHAVLFLILAFFNAAGLFLMVGAEFLALILIVVYVGAVAVLFLFVVMMLDVDFSELREGFLDYLPVGMLVGGIFLFELIMVLASFFSGSSLSQSIIVSTKSNAELSNIEQIGQVLYTEYVFFFQSAGIILLVAMIGAIVLTLRHKPGVKRQSISAQNARKPEDAVELISIEPGKGL